MRSWLTAHNSHCGGRNSKEEGPLVPLNTLPSLDCSNGEISTSHETVAYHPESPSLANEEMEEGAIKKETKMSVSYEKAANLEKGSPHNL